MRRARRLGFVLLASLIALAGAARAQEPYPSRPITIVVPFPPGGVADLTARPVAAAMEKALKNPVGVVNKTGAAGAVGMQFVATGRPDGYTLLLALSSISIIPEADKLFGRPPAFTVDQFAPIALISADPTILVVPADKPWKTPKDFIADAKRRPGQISFSSSGVYGTLHMAMELFAHAAGIKLRHVPYAGAGPALTAILGGHVDALASGPAVVLPQTSPCLAAVGATEACAKANHIDLSSDMGMNMDPNPPAGDCKQGNACTQCLCKAAGDVTKSQACVVGDCATP